MWSLLQSRRTQFINTVTSERVKWIQELRKNMSELSGAVHTWVLSIDSDEKQAIERGKLLEKIDRLGYLIRLQLNPNDQPDKEIEGLIRELGALADPTNLEPLKDHLEKLIALTQTLLKNEWEKVKKEATQGILPNLGNLQNVFADLKI